MLQRFTLTVKLCFFSEATLIDWKFGRFDESVEIVSLPRFNESCFYAKRIKRKFNQRNRKGIRETSGKCTVNGTKALFAIAKRTV